MQNTVLEVNRSSHDETRLTTEELAPLADGQVLLKIDRFALTANNVTYAVAGDMLGYWDFFPAADGWGRVPAMGWADVVESNHPGVEAGGRYYGWFPMAQYVSMTVGVTADGLRDDGDHRQAHAPVYRSYVETSKDPWYDDSPGGEERHALLRGLFLTAFLADEFFADKAYFDAEQVVVLSASSKTAIGFAQRASEREGLEVVGLTSAGNRELVESLGYYDQVVTYDAIDTIAVKPSVAIDMAGSSAILAQVHDRLDAQLGCSLTVGMSHHDATTVPVTSGPTPTFFFAPSEVTTRSEQWGADEYRRRTTEALTSFVTASSAWLDLEITTGPEAGQETWNAVFAGQVAPSVGRIVSMH